MGTGHETLMLCGTILIVMAAIIAKDVRRWRREAREDEARRLRLLEEERKRAAECYSCQARILTKGATVRDAK
jgi:hypothetical protein